MNIISPILQGSSGGSAVKNPPAMQETACNAGDTGSIPGLGRCPGEENSKPVQYSCPENPMDEGAWWSTVHDATSVEQT